MSPQDKKEITAFHNENLRKALQLVKEGCCDLLILDEITAAYQYQLVDCSLIDELILNKSAELELVLTGRDPAPLFLEKADYISEIKKIKHPFDKNITARKGIEL